MRGVWRVRSNNLWAVDEGIAEDMGIVFRLVARANSYADTFGSARNSRVILSVWRHEQLNDSHSRPSVPGQLSMA